MMQTSIVPKSVGGTAGQGRAGQGRASESRTEQVQTGQERAARLMQHANINMADMTAVFLHLHLQTAHNIIHAALWYMP